MPAFTIRNWGFHYPERPVIKPSADGKNWTVSTMEWALFLHMFPTRHAVDKFRNGYKDACDKFQIGYTTFNAMGEEVLNTSMYKDAALKRRCLVLS